jgi:hypothetical protein
VGFVHRRRQLIRAEGSGEVNEGERGAGHGDVVAPGDVGGIKPRPAVDDDAAVTRVTWGRNGDVEGTETWIVRSSLLRMRMRAPPETWLRNARGPQARTAAIQRPYWLTSGRPTEYTPGKS